MNESHLPLKLILAGGIYATPQGVLTPSCQLTAGTF